MENRKQSQGGVTPGPIPHHHQELCPRDISQKLGHLQKLFTYHGYEKLSWFQSTWKMVTLDVGSTTVLTSSIAALYSFVVAPASTTTSFDGFPGKAFVEMKDSWLPSFFSKSSLVKFSAMSKLSCATIIFPQITNIKLIRYPENVILERAPEEKASFPPIPDTTSANREVPWHKETPLEPVFQETKAHSAFAIDCWLEFYVPNARHNAQNLF